MLINFSDEYNSWYNLYVKILIKFIGRLHLLLQKYTEHNIFI